MSSEPQITLYTAQTPNGTKISIALEVLGLPYKTKAISFGKNEQKDPWFLAVNPNGRIPAITDHKPPGLEDGKELHLMESGAILLYLADVHDKEGKISYPKGSREYWDMIQWVFWQNAGLGPMQGQSNHFTRYAPEKIQYGIDRYQNETRRLYGILNKRLEESSSGFIVGDHVSIADITCFGWSESAPWAGIELEEFPKVQEWLKKMRTVEGVSKGADVPEPSKLRSLIGDKEAMDKHAKESSAWIIKGQQDDAKQK